MIYKWTTNTKTSKHIKQLIERSAETEKSKIIVRDLNSSSSATDRTARENINNDIEDQINIINRIEFPYIQLSTKEENTHFCKYSWNRAYPGP